ncbi:hypothetical protein C0Q70_13569 [Pomacea canaliculata]|uniref:Uncharacterized protein n=1 Tax=Pomacea canaliculata TaxID=400727 RepID=A0A2T7NXL1_POMCA|nr:hypothetical protein C0Q70_13569 [Pomacea canaliculata]
MKLSGGMQLEETLGGPCNPSSHNCTRIPSDLLEREVELAAGIWRGGCTLGLGSVLTLDFTEDSIHSSSSTKGSTVGQSYPARMRINIRDPHADYQCSRSFPLPVALFPRPTAPTTTP